MELYKCELVADGIIYERFYRQGKSISHVADDLEFFQWSAPKHSRWNIHPVN